MDAVSRMNNPPITLINVFTVDPAKQDELVDLLARATETSVRHAARAAALRKQKPTNIDKHFVLLRAVVFHVAKSLLKR